MILRRIIFKIILAFFRRSWYSKRHTYFRVKRLPLPAQPGGTMTYEQFKQRLADNLSALFPAGTHISIRQFSHNNHILLDGLTILEPGSNVSPTIYLNSYFDKYQNGTSFSALQNQILSYYYEHCSLRNIDTSFFTCYDKIRSRIVYKLIHYERNRELLKEVPHIPYLDLAIVFYCLIQEGPCKNAAIPICNEHLEYWNISKEELYHAARENTPALLPLCCDSLADLVLPALDLLPAPERAAAQETFHSQIVPMYVITNQKRFNGACCILYQNALQQAAEHLKDCLYILPSSVHEVIVIPASAAGDPKELPSLVQEINITEVAPEEVLSDCVYYYNMHTGQTSVYESS